MALNNLTANLISSLNICLKHKKSNNKVIFSKFVTQILLKMKEMKIVKSIKYSGKTSAEEFLASKGIHKVEHHLKNSQKPYLYYELQHINHKFMYHNMKLMFSKSTEFYVNEKEIKKYMKKYEDGLVSTDKGVMNFNECLNYDRGQTTDKSGVVVSMKKGIGGRLICFIN